MSNLLDKTKPDCGVALLIERLVLAQHRRSARTLRRILNVMDEDEDYISSVAENFTNMDSNIFLSSTDVAVSVIVAIAKTEKINLSQDIIEKGLKSFGIYKREVPVIDRSERHRAYHRPSK